MTGRRLYEIVCNARHAEIGTISREGDVVALPYEVFNGHAETSFSRNVPPAWPYLSRSEKRAWSTAAKRLKSGRPATTQGRPSQAATA